MSESAGRVSSAQVAARYRAERRFRMYGLAALGVTALFLIFLVADIAVKSVPAFTEYRVRLAVSVDESAKSIHSQRQHRTIHSKEVCT